MNETKKPCKSVCLHCKKEIVADIPKLYCPDDLCRDLHQASKVLGEERQRLTCQRCQYTWVPKRKGLPARCARCMSLLWNGSRKRKKLLDESMSKSRNCHHCGASMGNKIVCPECKSYRPEATHRYGITIKQWRRVEAFLMLNLENETLKVLRDAVEKVLKDVGIEPKWSTKEPEEPEVMEPESPNPEAEEETVWHESEAEDLLKAVGKEIDKEQALALLEELQWE